MEIGLNTNIPTENLDHPTKFQTCKNVIPTNDTELYVEFVLTILQIHVGAYLPT